MEKISPNSSTTTVEVNGREIALTYEQLEAVVRQQDNADNVSSLIAKIVEAGSACKLTISQGKSKRPMLSWVVSLRQGETQIIGTLRVMRGKSGVTGMDMQLEQLKGQFPQAQDQTV